MTSALLDTRKATQYSTKVKEKFRESSQLIRDLSLLTESNLDGEVDSGMSDTTEVHWCGFLHA